MKKTIVLIVLLAGVFGASTVYSVGIGLAGGAAFGGNMPSTNLIATYSGGKGEVIIGLGSNFSAKPAIGLSVDYWIRNNELVDVLKWFVGIGGYVATQIDGQDSTFMIGARLPIGLNIFILDNVIEFYAEVAPTLGIGTVNPTWGFQGSLGMRIWTD